jgi:hypothetical protein
LVGCANGGKKPNNSAYRDDGALPGCGVGGSGSVGIAVACHGHTRHSRCRGAGVHRNCRRSAEKEAEEGGTQDRSTRAAGQRFLESVEFFLQVNEPASLASVAYGYFDL